MQQNYQKDKYAAPQHNPQIANNPQIGESKHKPCQVQENNTKYIFENSIDMGQNFVVKFWRPDSCQKDNYRAKRNPDQIGQGFQINNDYHRLTWFISTIL